MRGSGLPLCIVTVAVVVRFALLWITFPGDDKVRYWEDVMIATNIVEGRGYSLDFTMRTHSYYELFLNHKIEGAVTEGVRPTAVKTPVYPLLLALIFLVFGVKVFFPVFCVHILASGLTAAALFASLSSQSRLRAVLASLAFACYPPMIHHSVTTPEPTSLLLLLISVFFYQTVRTVRKPSKSNFLIEGTLAGILALTEPVTVPFTLIILFWASFAVVHMNRERLLRFALAFAALILIITPWTIRNYVVFDEVIHLKTPVGMNILRGLQSSGAGLWIPEETLLAFEKRGRTLNEAEEDKLFSETLQEVIRNDPSRFLRVLPENFINFGWETKPYRTNTTPAYMFGRRLPYTAILLLGLPAVLWSVGAMMRRRKRFLVQEPDLAVALTLIATLTAVYSLIGAWNLRFHLPVELALFFFLAKTVTTLSENARGQATEKDGV